MKHIKNFESYYSDVILHFKYLDLQILENGDMKIYLNDEGKEYSEDGFNEFDFYDMFDDIRANSDYTYVSDLSEVGLGMSNAPCILYGYSIDDDANYAPFDDSEIYIYSDYIYKDFTKELLEDGYVIFQTIQPKTLEEIEKYRINRDTKKYNL